jgi:DnaD/phage-associated family protein
VPDAFFSHVLPRLTDPAEIKVFLHVLWAVYRVRRYPRYVTRRELGADRVLASSLDGGVDSKGSLDKSLAIAVEHGLLLHVLIESDGKREDVYVINDESGRQALRRLQAAGVHTGPPDPAVDVPPVQRPNVFALYESAIGVLTLPISEELKEAEAQYPQEWIEEAFRLAAEKNARNWRYVKSILERWEREGKDSGASGRPDKKTDGRYLQGKRGPLIPWR